MPDGDSRLAAGHDPLALDPATMRAMGYRVIDLLVERLAGLDAQPAWQGATRAELEQRLKRPTPSAATPFDEIIDELTTAVLPYAARVDHPRFLAFVPGAPTWPGVLSDLLVAGYNVFQGTWLGSAGPSAVELIVLDWFRGWLGMPEGATGLFLSGGSAANLTALACARLSRFDAHDPAAVLYLSDEAHSSVARAARTLGFAADRVRAIASDASYRMRVDALRAAVDADVAAGLTPFLVVANGGTTSTGAVDPLPELVAFCRERALWLHVDAAYGGFAVLTEEGRTALRGIGAADSVTLDPHKLLYQPFEAGCLLVRDGAMLERAFRVLPVYLQDTDVRRAATAPPTHSAPDGVNFADRGVQLTRSARAIKVWVSLQHFGIAAFRNAIERSTALARHAEVRIRASATLELLTPAAFGVVCFVRRVAGDEAEGERVNALLVKRLAESGEGLISSTRLKGRYALRFCILSHHTRQEDVDRLIDWFETAAC
jgi:glutamate/tyrosine decarboxylase-like PLP-dependent enzyme